jgi:ABC-type transport system substrate-binding protein
MKSWMIGLPAAALAGCCSSAPAPAQRTTAPAPAASVQVPSIPDTVKPLNGTVVEYWPNGMTRAELIYHAGRVVNAVYSASNGTVFYEMQEDQDRPAVAVEKPR